MSTDQSRPVIARSRDGKPMVSSGAVITRSGLTVAIGALDNAPEVISVESTGISTLLLTTDGYHESPSFTEKNVISMCSCLALKKRFSMHETTVRDEQRDDASVLVIRNNEIAPDEVVRMQSAVATRTDFKSEGIGFFAASTILRDIITNSVELNTFNDTLRFLEYARKYQIDLGKSALVTLADKAAPTGETGRKLFLTLIDTIRICSNP